MAPLCTVPSGGALTSLEVNADPAVRGFSSAFIEASLAAGWGAPRCDSEASTPSTSGSLRSDCSTAGSGCRSDASREEFVGSQFGEFLREATFRSCNDAVTATAFVPHRHSAGSTASSVESGEGEANDQPAGLPFLRREGPATRLLGQDNLNRTASEMRLCELGSRGELAPCQYSPTPEYEFPPRAFALSLLAARQMSIERELCQRYHTGLGGNLEPTAEAEEALETSSFVASEQVEAEASPSNGGSGFLSWLRWSREDTTRGDAPKPAPESQPMSGQSDATSEAVELHSAIAMLMGRLTLKEAGPVHSGAIVLTGNLEDRPEVICNALREALLSSVETETRNELIVCVWRGTDSAASAGPTVMASEAQAGVLSLDACSFERFNFQIMVTDPRDKLPVLRALLLEAASAGARRFLPALVDAFAEVGRLAVRLEVSHTRA